MKIFHALLLISLALTYCDGERILAVFPFPGPSQFICVKTLLETLAERGHDVNVISVFPQKDKLPNYTDVTVLEVTENYDESVNDIFEERNYWTTLNFYESFYTNNTLRVLKDPQVQKLMKSGEKFDIVFVETLNVDALYGLAQHFNAHLVGLSTFGTDGRIDELVGNPSPISYTPQVTSKFTDHMTFMERFEAFVTYIIDLVYFQIIHMPKQEKFYKEYFPKSNLPLSEVRKNFSLILLNQHFSLSFPRPYVPNMIEVGGLNINHKPAPLPADMAEFINGAKHGVIYFSLGSNIKSSFLPNDTIQMLLNTFAALPQRVLWKIENTDLHGKPSNVYINKWFPQSDVLAHPNVKLFITHCGLLSIIEAIHHSVPVLGFPFFYDQFLNARRAVQGGFGLSYDINKITQTELKEAIEKILNDQSFNKQVKALSRRYHDQPMTPLETAVYWIEYILRHDGAKHLRVAAQDLNLIQYHCLDVVAVLLIGLHFIVFTIHRILSRLLRPKSKLKQN